MESLLAPANLAAPHSAAVARLTGFSARAPVGGAHAGPKACPSSGLENFPEATPGPRPRGMLSRATPACRGRAAGCWTGLGSTWGLNLPRASAPLGWSWGAGGGAAGAGGGGTGACLHYEVPAWSTGRGRGEVYSRGHFQGSCDVSKKLHLQNVPLLPRVSRHTLGCPGLGGGSVTLHLKQV